MSEARQLKRRALKKKMQPRITLQHGNRIRPSHEDDPIPHGLPLAMRCRPRVPKEYVPL